MNTTAIPPAPLTVEPVKRKWLPYIIATATALLVGLVIGTVLTSPPAAPAAQIERITTTVEVPTAAPACLDVIEHSNRIQGLMRHGLTISGRMVVAASSMDLTQMQRETATLEKLTPQLGSVADDYWASVEDCKAAR